VPSRKKKKKKKKKGRRIIIIIIIAIIMDTNATSFIAPVLQTRLTWCETIGGGSSQRIKIT